jgi:hypothetical protein
MAQLFNGRDLTGWTPDHPLQTYENYADTFRVEDGILRVSYDKYDGDFGAAPLQATCSTERFSRATSSASVPVRREQYPGSPRGDS